MSEIQKTEKEQEGHEQRGRTDSEWTLGWPHGLNQRAGVKKWWQTDRQTLWDQPAEFLLYKWDKGNKGFEQNFDMIKAVV